MKKLILLLIPLLALTLQSCKKDDPGPSQARLNFIFDFNVDGEPLEFGKTYVINGSTVSFDAANFYLGGLKLKLASGNILDLSSQYLLGGIGNSASLENPIDVTDITGIDYFIGVDSVTNAQSEEDFTTRTSDDPLSIQDPSMHWSWGTGYKFLRVDGDIDTDGDGTPDMGIAYHLGSNAMLKNRSQQDVIKLKGGDNDLMINFDLNQFFTGVDLSVELDTHTGNNLPLAQVLHSNLDAAITIK